MRRSRARSYRDDLERQWELARTIRDGPCQELASASFACEAVRPLLERESPGTAAAFHDILGMVLSTLAGARKLADALEPVEPRPEGLAYALNTLAARTTRNGLGLSVRFVSRGTVEVSDRCVADHLFRVARQAIQEVLTEAAAPSGGAWMDMVMASNDRQMELRISWKKLATPAAGRQDHRRRRWRTMKERTEALGGRLVMTDGSVSDTATLSCTFPVHSVRIARRTATHTR